MPKHRPPTSGYARIAQADEDDVDILEDSDEEDVYQGQSTLSGPRYASIQPMRQHGRMTAEAIGPPRHRRNSHGFSRPRSNSGVDIKAINARLERWADEIAQKFKIKRVKGKSEEEEQLEIHHSVFQAPDWIRPATRGTLLEEDDSAGRLTKFQFDEIVDSVRLAIEVGVHPLLISQGSSGSYFAKDRHGRVVGVFKPKDEEPYASKNPKWTKWIHRNLFPFFFGRACLIPNLSYVSEAAAYVLDVQLRTHLVPYTDIVALSSKSFHYDFWDRRAYYRKKKPFPEKVGSFQVFLRGYKDATKFLKEHPWPDQYNSGFRTDAAPRKKRRWAEECRPGGAQSEDEDEDDDSRATTADESQRRRAFWTDALQQSFREQLEKLVILDYIMRNTDRGLDNWMIKIDAKNQEASIVAEPPKSNGHVRSDSPAAHSSQSSKSDPYKREEQMTATSRSATPLNTTTQSEDVPNVSIGAIDNSLSWPWKHPDAWRSYPFGWLFLPVSLIGQPFSEATRRHFLPLLTSKDWWSDTQLALRKVFAQDADFKERMFARQMAVVKGQAWNVVETLKTQDHGPLELTRRARVCVWDDLVDIPIAVPLRMPSAEMRRRQADADARNAHDEMDISAAVSSAPEQQHDLLNLGSPNERPTNPFNISRQSSSMDIKHGDEYTNGPLSPSSVKAISWTGQGRQQLQRKANSAFSTPARPGARTRFSYDGPRRQQHPEPSRRNRQVPSHVRRSSTPYITTDDDLEGDLGYAAAEDMEGNQRRVIVERLEMVKAKNPVFTWC